MSMSAFRIKPHLVVTYKSKDGGWEVGQSVVGVAGYTTKKLKLARWLPHWAPMVLYPTVYSGEIDLHGVRTL
jgi:hypothetical protein